MVFDRKLFSCIACIAMGIAFVANCGDGGGDGGGPTGPAPAPTTATVTTGSAPPPRFIPASVTVAVGGTVTWRNGSPAPVVHNVRATGNAFQGSPDLNPNETFQVTFAQAGSFEYRCTIHPGMNGTVTVK